MKWKNTSREPAICRALYGVCEESHKPCSQRTFANKRRIQLRFFGHDNTNLLQPWQRASKLLTGFVRVRPLLPLPTTAAGCALIDQPVYRFIRKSVVSLPYPLVCLSLPHPLISAERKVTPNFRHVPRPSPVPFGYSSAACRRRNQAAAPFHLHLFLSLGPCSSFLAEFHAVLMGPINQSLLVLSCHAFS